MSRRPRSCRCPSPTPAESQDIDVFLGNWMRPWRRTSGPISRTARSRTSVSISRVPSTRSRVPAYLAEQGLKDFADIAKFRDQLEGQIYGIEPCNDGNRLILQMIEQDSFGLKGFEVVESSEQGMLAQVARAAQDKERSCSSAWNRIR